MSVTGASGEGRGFMAAVEAAAASTAARVQDAPIVRRELDADNVDDAGRQFEALFMSQLVKEMRKTLPDGFFGGGPGADTYEGWFDQHIGETLAAANTLDLVGILRAGLPSEGTLRAGADGENAR